MDINLEVGSRAFGEIPLWPESCHVYISYCGPIRSLIVLRSNLNVLLVGFSLSTTATLIVLDIIQCKVGK